jgi:hypothetical protein
MLFAGYSFGQCPDITCPSDTVLDNDPGVCGAVVNYTAPVGVDLCAGGADTFNLTGTEQTWIVPPGVTSVDIAAWGAQGGADGTVLGGLGGFATGTLAVTPGQTLYIYVGGQGTNGPGSGQNCNLPGGFNGGGPTGATCCSNAGAGAGAGGGASDVRIGGNTLNDRAIVAAGGGGSGSNLAGANGGGLVGDNGGTYNGVTATGGTQTAGGQAGGTFFPNHTCSPATDGVFGIGGDGDGNDGGGGGGGWYGGGGGANNSGGAGGSSYIGGVTGGSTTTGVNSGDGYVILNWVGGGTGVTTAQTAGMASGSTFPVGVTTNTYMATDGIDTVTCSFTVTVNETNPVTILMNSFNEDTMCVYDSPQVLPAVSPSGGTYSGAGVSGNVFDPAISGSGTFYVVYTYSSGGCPASDSAMVVVEDCLGLTEGTNLDVTIFPNPTEGVVNVTFNQDYSGATYYVATLDGKLVLPEGEIEGDELQIDLAEQPNGIYLLHIQVDSRTSIYKILKN